jgi:hypothetical protein
MKYMLLALTQFLASGADSTLKKISGAAATSQQVEIPETLPHLARLLFALQPASRSAEIGRRPSHSRPVILQSKNDRFHPAVRRQKQVVMESETYEEHTKHKAAGEGAEAAEKASEDESNEDDANASENEAQEETDDASGNETAEPEVPQGPPYMKFLRKRKADIVSGADIAETFALIEAEMKDLAERATEARTREALAILAKEQTLEKFTMVAEKNAKAEQVAAR